MAPEPDEADAAGGKDETGDQENAVDQGLAADEARAENRNGRTEENVRQANELKDEENLLTVVSAAFGSLMAAPLG